MSQLRTVLPVDIKVLTNHLPEHSTVLGISLLPDFTGVEVIWCNDKITTGRTYPVEYALDKLLGNGKVIVDNTKVDGRKKSKV